MTCAVCEMELFLLPASGQILCLHPPCPLYGVELGLDFENSAEASREKAVSFGRYASRAIALATEREQS